MKVYDFSVPYICGTFSDWRLKHMTHINDFVEKVRLNSMPNPRRYVKPDNTLLSKLGLIINEEITFWIRKYLSLKNINIWGTLEEIIY